MILRWYLVDGLVNKFVKQIVGLDYAGFSPLKMVRQFVILLHLRNWMLKLLTLNRFEGLKMYGVLKRPLCRLSGASPLVILLFILTQLRHAILYHWQRLQFDAFDVMTPISVMGAMSLLSRGYLGSKWNAGFFELDVLFTELRFKLLPLFSLALKLLVFWQTHVSGEMRLPPLIKLGFPPILFRGQLLEVKVNVI